MIANRIKQVLNNNTSSRILGQKINNKWEWTNRKQLKKLTEEIEQGNQASNRIKALHLLGQTVNMFGQKLEVENKQAERTSEEIAEDLKAKLQKLLAD